MKRSTKQAYQMDLDAKKNLDVSRALCPDSSLYDEKERDRIRKRVGRLIEPGGLEDLRTS